MVLGVGAFPQVRAAIVPLTAVDVINLDRLPPKDSPHDDSVHVRCFSVDPLQPSLDVSQRMNTPRVRCQQRKVVDVNKHIDDLFFSLELQDGVGHFGGSELSGV